MRAAVALIADTSWYAPGRPELYRAVREELGEEGLRIFLAEFNHPVQKEMQAQAALILRLWGWKVVPPSERGDV